MAFLKLLRDGGLRLASFCSVSTISLPATTARSPRVETLVTGAIPRKWHGAHAESVFLVEKPGKDTQRLIIDARVSNLHFLHPPGVSLVTLEGLSRVEVALENDEDPWELSKLEGLHLGLADLETAQLLLCPP